MDLNLPQCGPLKGHCSLLNRSTPFPQSPSSILWTQSYHFLFYEIIKKRMATHMLILSFCIQPSRVVWFNLFLYRGTWNKPGHQSITILGDSACRDLCMHYACRSCELFLESLLFYLAVFASCWWTGSGLFWLLSHVIKVVVSSEDWFPLRAFTLTQQSQASRHICESSLPWTEREETHHVRCDIHIVCMTSSNAVEMGW